MSEFKYNKKWTIWIIIGVFLLFGVSSYNSLVSLDEGVTSQWANVENVYQRRSDLIPNLVNTVKGYATHEKETFTSVIEARAKASSVSIDAGNLNSETIQKFQQAQGGLTSALGKLMVVVERYPDLKANQNFLELQAQLEGTENRIAFERKKYNDTAKVYNSKIRKFPIVLYSGMLGFEKKGYFEAQEGADKAPEVQF